jgi:glycosyltransferase involved in cell wall biosynthesis
MKILLIATYPTLSTGYARVANRLGNYLAGLPGVEVWHFGFENYAGVTIADRFVDPRIRLIDVASRVEPATDRFGTTLIKDVVETEVRPDKIIVYNDVVVTCQFLNNFMAADRPFEVVSYLDLVYEYETVEFVKHIDRWSDRVFVFSECWRRHLVGDFGFEPAKVGVFEHGFDSDVFRPMDKTEARRALGLPEADYLVLNTNRNSYRKGLDITIGGFLRFWKALACPDAVKLVLNCRLDVTDGYDVPNLVRVECMKLGLDEDRVLNHQILTTGDRAGLLTEEKHNALYNAADVGLNTCVGEGFGLCNLEGAGLGVPQIVSDVGGLRDIFGGGSFGCALVPARPFMYLARGIDSHGGEIRVCDPGDVAVALLTTYGAKKSEALRARILERYHWPTLLREFSDALLGPVAASSSAPASLRSPAASASLRSASSLNKTPMPRNDPTTESY